MSIVSFSELTSYASKCIDKTFPEPVDWGQKSIATVNFLKTKCTDFLVFEVETEEGTDIFACTSADKEFPIKDRTIFTPTYFDESPKWKPYIELIYELNRKPPRLDEAEILNEDMQCQDYWDILKIGEIVYIKFNPDIQFNKIYLEYIYYKMEEYDTQNFQETVDKLILKINTLSNDELIAIVNFFNYDTEVHIFMDLYAYVESKLTLKEESIQDILCATCKAVAQICDECKEKIAKPRLIVNWNEVRINLKKSYKAINIDPGNEHKIYAGLKDTRNIIFHYKVERQNKIKVICDNFPLYIYHLLFVLSTFASPSQPE